MSVEAVLERARTLGVRLSVEGEYLLYQPKSVAPPDFVEALRQHKVALLAILQGTSQAVAPCPRCPWPHPEGCPLCCLPVPMTVSDPLHVPDAGIVLSRWHALGHPDVPLDDVRKVRQLPMWMLLLTPGGLKDLAAMRLALGMSTDAGGASCP